MSDTVEFLLRSLRDLEAEHAAGDLDDADYQALKDDYTARAAAALRSRDAPSDPAPPAAVVGEAPPLAAVAEGEPLAPVPDGEPPAADGEPPAAVVGEGEPLAPVAEGEPARARRRWWRFLVLAVGVVVVAAGIVWAVAAATSTRTPGETVTGQQLGQNQTNHLLTSAQQALDKGDAVSALKDYQQILRADPRQIDALTGEGWLLAQTQQTSLVDQGLALLQTAEQVDPTYTPAHLYRGVTLITQSQYQAAIPELQYYLAHDPAPALKPKVQQALSQAQAALARPAAPSTSAP